MPHRPNVFDAGSALLVHLIAFEIALHCASLCRINVLKKDAKCSPTAVLPLKSRLQPQSFAYVRTSFCAFRRTRTMWHVEDHLDFLSIHANFININVKYDRLFCIKNCWLSCMWCDIFCQRYVTSPTGELEKSYFLKRTERDVLSFLKGAKPRTGFSCSTALQLHNR